MQYIHSSCRVPVTCVVSTCICVNIHIHTDIAIGMYICIYYIHILCNVMDCDDMSKKWTIWLIRLCTAVGGWLSNNIGRANPVSQNRMQNQPFQMQTPQLCRACDLHLFLPIAPLAGLGFVVLKNRRIGQLRVRRATCWSLIGLSASGEFLGVSWTTSKSARALGRSDVLKPNRLKHFSLLLPKTLVQMQTRNEAMRQETQLAGSRHHIKWKLAPNKMKKPTISLKHANKNDEANLVSFYWNSWKGDLAWCSQLNNVNREFPAPTPSPSKRMAPHSSEDLRWSRLWCLAIGPIKHRCLHV